MTMDARLWRLAIWCAEQELECRKAGTRPGGVKRWNGELVRALQLQLAVSRSGHEFGCGSARSEADKLISAREAAALLGMSKRQVCRLVTDLEGISVDGHLIFRESVVAEYAKGREGGRIAG